MNMCLIVCEYDYEYDVPLYILVQEIIISVMRGTHSSN